MKKTSLGLLLMALTAFCLTGCGDPELAGDAAKPETGMLRVINLTEDELSVKFGSQLNASPLPPHSGTLWQKQRVGSTKVTVTKGEMKDLGGQADVAKGEVTSFVVMPGKGGVHSYTLKESGDHASAADSAAVNVVHAAQEGIQTSMTVTPQGGSPLKLEPLKPQAVFVKSEGKSKFLFETGSGSRKEAEFEFELGGSYTIFVTVDAGGPVAAMVRNDQKLSAVGESGASR